MTGGDIPMPARYHKQSRISLKSSMPCLIAAPDAIFSSGRLPLPLPPVPQKKQVKSLALRWQLNLSLRQHLIVLARCDPLSRSNAQPMPVRIILGQDGDETTDRPPYETGPNDRDKPIRYIVPPQVNGTNTSHGEKGDGRKCGRAPSKAVAGHQ